MNNENVGLQDRVDISDLLAKYVWAYDCRQYEEVGKVFLPDGILESPGRFRVKGRKEIVEWLREHVESKHSTKVMQHVISHSRYFTVGDEIRVYSYWMVPAREDVSKPECVIGNFGWSEDTVVKKEGAWLIKKRYFTTGVPKSFPWEDIA